MGAPNAYPVAIATLRPNAYHAAMLLSPTSSNPAICRAGVLEMIALHQSTAILAQERRQFRMVYSVAFIVFLGMALIARLLPGRLRPWAPSGNRHLSCVAEARAVTDTVIPFAFL